MELAVAVLLDDVVDVVLAQEGLDRVGEREGAATNKRKTTTAGGERLQRNANTTATPRHNTTQINGTQSNIT